MFWPFIPHRTYSRRKDLHGLFGGQQQGGISTPASLPGIFVFTKVGGNRVGYHDRFQPDGSLLYTGEGQTGDMKMKGGNAAIRDHAANGKDLLVFSQHIKGGPVTFEGLFVCATWHFETQNGVDGPRQAIVFKLDPLREEPIEAEDDAVLSPSSLDITDLRSRAYAAAAPAQKSAGASRSTTFERSRDVRDYVLARADGVCEACDAPAPFLTAAGRPYLEAHHIRRLSDGGPDHPRHVAGVCPTCHRRAHYGTDRRLFNETLGRKIVKVEAAPLV